MIIPGFEERYVELIEARDTAYGDACRDNPNFRFVNFRPDGPKISLSGRSGKTISVDSMVQLFGPRTIDRNRESMQGNVAACLPIKTSEDHAKFLGYRGDVVPYLLWLASDGVEIGTADATKIGTDSPGLSESIGYYGRRLFVPPGIVPPYHGKAIFHIMDWSARVLRGEPDLKVKRATTI